MTSEDMVRITSKEQFLALPDGSKVYYSAYDIFEPKHYYLIWHSTNECQYHRPDGTPAATKQRVEMVAGRLHLSPKR